MLPQTTTTLLLTTLPLASAHGFVQYITPLPPNPSPTVHLGYDPGFRFSSPAPRVAGWYADNPDIGFVPPSSFAHPDIICHKSAVPGATHIPVRAGTNLTLQWLTWPESHVGPVMDYLAACPGGDCSVVEKTGLRFTKIAQAGLKEGVTGGTNWLHAWRVDDLIRRDNFTWTVTVPEGLKAGAYVLRHEILALHSAWEKGGAQACTYLIPDGPGRYILPTGSSRSSRNPCSFLKLW
ncbi:glycosyl hydrolase family 61-domain-containing protein [Schizothecium vesticola]|uniref:lytic cellulose monooxygenase (C4-dehydrogenating) n=1 Tax=Schizothecium vesticola TaxID=314040 RepID=A0AA40EIW5_9PEZI|nr:glycosyl hydrolase family 61-domain-containing protein [Schizothecium vesticola]